MNVVSQLMSQPALLIIWKYMTRIFKFKMLNFDRSQVCPLVKIGWNFLGSVGTYLFLD
jgi:hypothetical protein